MKKSVIVLLVVVLVISGCGEKTAEQRLAEGRYEDTTTDHMVPSDYAGLEQNIDQLINEGNIIGPRHHDELGAAINDLERSGVDVFELRRKLDLIPVDWPEGVEDKKPPEQGYIDERIVETEPIRQGLLSPRGCEGEGVVMLGTSPLDINNIEKIRPMGGMSTVHITPTDHQYWDTIESDGINDATTNLDRFDLKAPADGYIVDIEIHKDYRVVIEHSCSFYTTFLHVDLLKDHIWSQIKEEDGDITSHVWPRIPVKEGEVFGTIGVGKFDFYVVDGDVTLEGFASPELYKDEAWKIHTVDIFDYYKEPVRSQLLEKNVRTAELLGGKIDYDINGKIVGNWFKEGTGGYKGSGDTDNYWGGHLAIAYDSIDPEHIIISMGDFDGSSRQYGVKGNTPDPKDVDVNSGMIEYELVPIDYYVGNEKWDISKFATNIKAKNRDEVRGVALFQLISDKRLKVEFFPGKEGSQVSGFTSAANFFER